MDYTPGYPLQTREATPAELELLAKLGDSFIEITPELRKKIDGLDFVTYDDMKEAR